jgi:hypothetical protein
LICTYIRKSSAHFLQKVLAILKERLKQKPYQRLKGRAYDTTHPEYHFASESINNIHDICSTKSQPHTQALNARSNHFLRNQIAVTTGYNTSDDFGNDGDDTHHTRLPYYQQPSVFAANASFPADGSTPKTIDLIFVSFLERDNHILPVLREAGANYTSSDISYYMPASFDIGAALIEYAKVKWGENIKDCHI